jgi:hypothetical protein
MTQRLTLTIMGREF